LYFTARAYKNFRVTGGIHGKLGRPKPKKEETKPSKKNNKKSAEGKKEQLTDKLLPGEETTATADWHNDQEKGPTQL